MGLAWLPSQLYGVAAADSTAIAACGQGGCFAAECAAALLTSLRVLFFSCY